MPKPLPSAVQGQWYKKTFACLPTGNWDWGGQGLCILDDGTVWAFMRRSAQRVWDGTGYENETWWMGTISPEGCVRYSVDDFSLYDGPTHDSDDWPVEGHIGEKPVYWAWGEEYCVTDGTHIYVFEPNKRSWWKLDPQTKQLTYMAGGGTLYTYFTDSHDGAQATFVDPGWAYCYDGYLYFCDRQTYPTTYYYQLAVRRMKLEPPYSVETWWNEIPVGKPSEPTYPYGNDWYAEINTSTGLPNYLNGDVLIQGSSYVLGYQGIVVWDGYVYVRSTIQGINRPNGEIAMLKRRALTGGDWETLWYTVDTRSYNYGSADPPMPRDGTHDYIETPYGTYTEPPVPGFWVANAQSRGTPELEGVKPALNPMVVLDDGTLIMQSLTGMYTLWNYGVDGGPIIAFDLPSLITQYERSGPIRHDRNKPAYRTISNGTALEEQYNTDWNYNLDFSAWQYRDGSRPLHHYVLAPGMATSSHPDWKGKVLCMSMQSGYIVCDQDGDVSGAVMCFTLEPSSSASEFSVQLSFEGRTLKGYAAAHDLHAPSAPNIVTLS